MEFLQIGLTGAAVLGAWLSALLVWRSGVRTIAQREVQGRREEWWRRFQWSTELAFDPLGVRAQTGAALLRVMQASPLAEAPEREAVRAVLISMMKAGPAGDTDTVAPATSEGRTEHGDG